MQASLHHLQLNVSDKGVSFPFYKEFLSIFGFKIAYEDANVLGMTDGVVSLWFEPARTARSKAKYHRKRTGINHVALKVPRKEDVDEFKRKFLDVRGIVSLYDSPRIFSEYSPTYYAVYFEDPDRVKLEIVAT